MAKDKKEKEDKGFSWKSKKDEKKVEKVVVDEPVAVPVAAPVSMPPFAGIRPKRKMRGIRIAAGRKE